MYFLALKPPSIPSPFPNSTIPSKPINIKLKNYQLYTKNPVFFNSLECRRRAGRLKLRNHPDSTRFSIFCFAVDEAPVDTLNVSDRVRLLVSEFRSLPEAIDRVKRLLHYATLLPPFDDSEQVQENRVMGCTAQVWLAVRMDSEGHMRFRVDSDSEITKGFCSCLIWLLDGAAPEEVSSVRADDLAEMNIGLPSTARSRVNTWHNVLISMQSRTRDCVRDRERDRLLSLDEIPSLLARPDVHICTNGSYKASMGSTSGGAIANRP